MKNYLVVAKVRDTKLSRVSHRRGVVVFIDGFLGAGLNAALLIGIIWTFWHMPLILAGNGSTMTQEIFVTYLLYTIAASIIYSWLYFKTNSSLLMVGLFHGAINTYFIFFPLLHATTGQGLNAYGTGMILFVAALMVPYLLHYGSLKQMEKDK